MSQKTIYHNGKIATNSTPYFAEAMVVGDGKVLATGTSSNLLQTREAGTKLVDLGGHTVIPGLNDSHMHVIRGGLHYNLELRWDGVPSLADAMRMLKEQVLRTPAPQWQLVLKRGRCKGIARSRSTRRFCCSHLGLLFCAGAGD